MMKKLLHSAVLAAAISTPLMPLQSSAATGIDPVYPTIISNMNIWHAYTQYQIMLEEIARSISKKNPGLLSHDAVRWESYINAIRSEFDYWQSTAFIDFPVTHGRDWELVGPLDLTCDFKDAPSVCQLMALVVNARDELALSTSAELPMHLYPADRARQDQYWNAMLGYITYLQTSGPLDEPVTAAEERLGLVPGFDSPPAL